MWDKALDLVNGHPYHARLFGALAQLGERNTGSVEVSGSIPLGSTNSLAFIAVCSLATLILLAFWPFGLLPFCRASVTLLPRARLAVVLSDLRSRSPPCGYARRYTASDTRGLSDYAASLTPFSTLHHRYGFRQHRFQFALDG